MGMYKILMKSIVFSTRSRRRFFTFVSVFTILSGATIILLYNFDNFSREGLLIQRGVVIRAASMDTVTLTTAQNDIPISSGDTRTSDVIFFKYVNFGTDLRIFSMSSDYVWAFDQISPTDLAAGQFPSTDKDVLISEDTLLQLQAVQGPVNIYTNPVVGTTIRIGRSDDSEFNLKISGIYKPPTPITIDKASSGRDWIFITEEAFETLIDGQNLDYEPDQIYVHSISIIASGDFISGNVYNNVESLYEELAPTINVLPLYNDVVYTEKSLKEEGRSFALLALLFGMFGTFMVSTLYSYLITRFRRREVAVLKAMGYSKWNVRTVVLSEILVVAITGFIIGLLAIQGYLWFTKQGAYYYRIILSPTSLFSFGAVVLSCIPGFFMITFRILSVRPIEIFRQK